MTSKQERKASTSEYGEPWEVREFAPGELYPVKITNNNGAAGVCAMFKLPYSGPQTALGINWNGVEKRAARIVQCVNVLSGKNPDKLDRLIKATEEVVCSSRPVPSHIMNELQNALTAYNRV